MLRLDSVTVLQPVSSNVSQSQLVLHHGNHKALVLTILFLNNLSGSASNAATFWLSSPFCLSCWSVLTRRDSIAIIIFRHSFLIRKLMNMLYVTVVDAERVFLVEMMWQLTCC